MSSGNDCIDVKEVLEKLSEELTFLHCIEKNDIVGAMRISSKIGRTPQKEVIALAHNTIRNLQADNINYAKTLKSVRTNLMIVNDGLEDEGDRIYLGSVNDAEQIKLAFERLDEIEMDQYMRDGALLDIYASAREANEQLAFIIKSCIPILNCRISVFEKLLRQIGSLQSKDPDDLTGLKRSDVLEALKKAFEPIPNLDFRDGKLYQIGPNGKEVELGKVTTFEREPWEKPGREEEPEGPGAT